MSKSIKTSIVVATLLTISGTSFSKHITSSQCRINNNRVMNMGKLSGNCALNKAETWDFSVVLNNGNVVDSGTFVSYCNGKGYANAKKNGRYNIQWISMISSIWSKTQGFDKFSASNCQFKNFGTLNGSNNPNLGGSAVSSKPAKPQPQNTPKYKKIYKSVSGSRRGTSSCYKSSIMKDILQSKCNKLADQARNWGQKVVYNKVQDGFKFNYSNKRQTFNGRSCTASASGTCVLTVRK